MKIITIIGARPQIIKASALSRAIRKSFAHKIDEIIVHTGQHYDHNMSEVFFYELQIPRPKYNLNVGSGKHGVQTGKMIEGIEKLLEEERPNAIVLYGDTNSTLAGAIAASKIYVPVVHIEAGLRSFNKSMPEEVNRIVCDHVSTIMFAPTQTGYDNLIREGFSKELRNRPDADHPNVYLSGDIMYDNTLYFTSLAEQRTELKEKYGTGFILCTIHRDLNTDNPERLKSIFDAIQYLSCQHQFILPLHPRTKKMMPQVLGEEYCNNINCNPNLKIIEPVSFLEMIYLEKNSDIILTDSGGVQKEAYFMKKPCVIMRPETEWVEIVKSGNAVIADADYNKIISSVERFCKESQNLVFPPLFGDGNAADFMCRKILENIG